MFTRLIIKYCGTILYKENIYTQDAQIVRTVRADCMRIAQQSAKWMSPSFLRKRHAEHEAHNYLLLRWHGR